MRHHADARMQALLRHVAQVLPVDAHRATIDIIEAEEKPPDGRFARTGRADQRHGFARADLEGQAFQDGPRRVIAKLHIVELDLSPGAVQLPRAVTIHHIGGLAQQVEHLAHIDQRLPDLAIDRAEEVQRQGDLDHVGVDHDEIAHRQVATLDPHGRHHHDDDQPHRDDHGLAEIQVAERIGRADRGILIARHGAVIARGLALFGPEILDGLEIEKAVDGLLVGIRVLVVHLLADLHPPFRHFEREPDVDRDGDGDDDEIPDVEDHGEDDADHQKLQHQRPDGKEHEAQKELDPLHAPLDDAAEAPRLAGDVVAQAERVDMLEGLQRQLSQCALADAGEDHVAQLREPHRHRPRHAIGHGQPHGPDGQPTGGVGLAGQHVHRVGIEKRRVDRDQPRHDQHHQRPDDARFDPWVGVGPEVGRDALDGAPAGSAGLVAGGMGGLFGWRMSGRCRLCAARPDDQIIRTPPACAFLHYSAGTASGIAKIWPG